MLFQQTNQEETTDPPIPNPETTDPTPEQKETIKDTGQEQVNGAGVATGGEEKKANTRTTPKNLKTHFTGVNTPQTQKLGKQDLTDCIRRNGLGRLN